mmetsp:Transcript_18370/g.54835  ORF Transcript_18370/g.54835 Transcript_18370/m.54835 type:complete len:205 (+) Transcript_18370:348-962(+)
MEHHVEGPAPPPRVEGHRIDLGIPHIPHRPDNEEHRLLAEHQVARLCPVSALQAAVPLGVQLLEVVRRADDGLARVLLQQHRGDLRLPLHLTILLAQLVGEIAWEVNLLHLGAERQTYEILVLGAVPERWIQTEHHRPSLVLLGFNQEHAGHMSIPDAVRLSLAPDPHHVGEKLEIVFPTGLHHGDVPQGREGLASRGQASTSQ